MKTNKNILIWGAGLRCSNTIEKLKQSKYCIKNKLKVKYIFDNTKKKLSFQTQVKFSNKINDLYKIIDECNYFVVAIGSEYGKARFLISNELLKRKLKPLNLIDKNSIIADNVISGKGFQSESGSIIQNNVKIGDFCILNTNASIDHHSNIGNGCHIMPGATVAGKVNIKDFVTIGSNATILPYITIETGAVIGAGSVITKNVKKNELVAGNPAKKIRVIKHKFDLSPFKK